jgi:hypothetical protein
VIFKRINFLFAGLLLCLGIQAQISLKIDIAVLSLDDNTPIDSCPVIMKTDKGEIFQFKTDQYGFLHYINNNASFTKAEFYTQTNKDVINIKHKYGFLASDERLKIDLSEKKEPVKLSYIFYLNPVIVCWSFPGLRFKINSSAYDTTYEDFKYGIARDSASCYPENTVLWIVKMLKENPEIIIELSAHSSSNEKFQDELSILRAEKVRLDFIRYGINEKRLIAKGYGIKKLKISDAQIKKAKTKEEKEALQSINRRCVFKIISWNFEEKPKTN